MLQLSFSENSLRFKKIVMNILCWKFSVWFLTARVPLSTSICNMWHKSGHLHHWRHQITPEALCMCQKTASLFQNRSRKHRCQNFTIAICRPFCPLICPWTRASSLIVSEPCIMFLSPDWLFFGLLRLWPISLPIVPFSTLFYLVTFLST